MSVRRRGTVVWDLNADLGEGEPSTRTRALLRRVTSANIACGGHAGTVATLARTVAAALENGVRIGAHPGIPGGFGRGAAGVDPADLQRLLLHQVGAVSVVAARAGAPLHHVKLHGSLYHAADACADLCDAYLSCVARWFPGLVVFARAGGRVARRAPRWGVPVWPEGFVDRGYRSDGTLVARGEPEALVRGGRAVTERIRHWAATGAIRAADGSEVRVAVRTWCVHADTAGAASLARAARAALESAGRGDVGGQSADGA